MVLSASPSQGVIHSRGVWGPKRSTEPQEAAGRKGEPRALLLVSPILIALCRGVWWHWPFPCATGDQLPPVQGKEEDQAWEQVSSSCRTPASCLGLFSPPAPPVNKPCPEIGHVGADAMQEGTVSGHQAKSTGQKTSYPPLSPMGGLPRVFPWKFRAISSLHMKGPVMYLGESISRRLRWRLLQGLSLLHSQQPVPAALGKKSPVALGVAFLPHSVGPLSGGHFMPCPGSERLLPMSCSQCLQPSTAISLPNEPFIYITSGMFGLHQSN